MTAGHQDCESCRGRGWKYLTLRRSPANAGAAAETETQHAARTPCLSCNGTGHKAVAP